MAILVTIYPQMDTAVVTRVTLSCNSFEFDTVSISYGEYSYVTGPWHYRIESLVNGLPRGSLGATTHTKENVS